MALFRSSIAKQRALVSRVSSVAVYYVHSHLQYTSASTSQDQVRQRLDFIANSFPSQNEQRSTVTKQVSQLSNHLDVGNYNCNDYHRHYKVHHQRQDKEFLEEVSTVEPLITPTQLAFMSMSYNEKWCKHFKTVYKNAMKSRELLTIHKSLSRHKAREKSNRSNDNLHRKYVQQVQQDEDINGGLPRENRSLDVMLFSSLDADTMEEKQKKTKRDDKCDPLRLAIVHQALRDELPVFFQKGHRYDLYHKRVKFINGLINTTFSGLRTYKFVMTSMRLAALICISDVRMDILKITKHSKDCNIKVRWRVSGVPRYATFMGRQKDNCRYVDGFSIFEVDTSGLIYCHRLMKLMPSQSSQTDNPLWALNTAAVISLLRQQKSFEMLARHRVEDIVMPPRHRVEDIVMPPF